MPEAAEYLKAESTELTTYNLELDYNYWSTSVYHCYMSIRY